MFDNKSEINLQLRKAADEGQNKKIRALLTSGAEINSQGTRTRQTALHRAATKGHFHSVTLLVNNKADVNLLDDKEKTALQLAVDAGHNEIAHFLHQISLCYQAVNVARNYFTESASSGSEIVKFRECHEKLYFEKKDSICEKIKNLLPVYLVRNALMYTEHVLESVAAIEAADKTGEQKGMCGELARAAFCFLSNKLLTETPRVCIEQMTVIVKEGNHTFLVLNRPLNSNLKNSKNWGNAIICDADHTTTINVYCCQEPPQGSIIANLPMLEDAKVISFAGFPELNDEYRETVEEIWCDLIKSSMVLINKKTNKSEMNEKQECKNFSKGC